MRWAAICVLALLPGCSIGGDEEPVRARGAAGEIELVVRELERAVRRDDGASVCDALLTRAARARMGGDRCAGRVAAAIGGLREPRVELVDLRLAPGERRAVAKLRTETARRSSDATVELRRERGEWRLESLRPGRRSQHRN